MKKAIFKKLISVCLAVMMVFGIMPFSAFAEINPFNANTLAIGGVNGEIKSGSYTVETIAYGDGTVCYEFVPEKDGEHVLMVYSDYNMTVTMTDAYYNEIACIEDNAVEIESFLEGAETYYLTINCSLKKGETAEVEMLLFPVVEAELDKISSVDSFVMGDAYACFVKFIPKTDGRYTLLGNDDNDYYVSLTDENFDVITQGFDVDGNPCQILSEELNGGETYYIALSVFPSEGTELEKIYFMLTHEHDFYNGICNICNKTESGCAVNGHDYASKVEEKRKVPTCTEDASYDNVVYCTDCKDEFLRETVIISPAFGHTEADPVEEKKVDATCTEDGSCDMVIYCSTCESEIVRGVTVFPALGHKASDPLEENRVESTCTESGSYDKVVYCSVCNEEISRDIIAIPAPGHALSEPIEENKVEATCTRDGSCDIVIYCTVCQTEISRRTTVIKATGHSNSVPVEENKIEATCTENGSYESVIYCDICGELSRETKIILAKGHNFGNWVVTTYPTMTTEGVRVRTCDNCDAAEEGVVASTGITIVVKDKSGKVVLERVTSGDLTSFYITNFTDGEYTITFSKANYATRTYPVTVSGGQARCDFKLHLLGDINGDGKLNTTDVARANAHAKGVTTLTDYAFVCADVTQDGRVNTLDVARLNAHAKGLNLIWFTPVDPQMFIVTYVTNGGSVINGKGESIRSEEYAENTILFESVTVSRPGYTFKGWFTDADLTTKFTRTRMPKKDITLYAKWEQSSFNLLLDANGGSVSTTGKTVVYDQPIGTLPVPTRSGCVFSGWYTSNGTKVTENTVFTSTSNMTLKARWTSSDWVLASNLPKDATVSSQKWTYTLTSTTSSSSSSLSGWTYTSKQRTGWGAEIGPVYSDPSNGTRNVRSEKYVSSTTTHYKYYHRYGWGYNISTGTNGYVWGSDSQLGSGSRHTIDLTYSLTPNGNFAGNANYKGYTCPHGCGSSNIWFPDGTYTVDNYSTRWYYREPVYTYYFKKVESKESTKEVKTSDAGSGETISNIQKWVKYTVQ